MKFKEVKLKDVLQTKGYIRGPFGSALKRRDLLSNGIPVYEQQHAIYGHRNFRFFISNDKYQEMERFTVKPDDLIISCSGTVGKVSKVQKEDPIGIISQALLILRADIEIVNPDFLAYFFRSNKGYNAIVSRSTGSVQVNISKRDVIEQIPVPLPERKVQEKIVNILRCLDEKIAINNKINNNLQQQAQAIFATEFLNRDNLPMGWVKSNLIGIADYLNGLAMQKFRPLENEASYPILKIKELRQGVCDSNSERCSANIKSDYIVHDGDVIFSWSGSLMVDIWCGGTCGLNQHLFKVTSSNYDKWFYYLWTNYHLQKFIAVAADRATTMGHIKREELAKTEVLIPSEEDYKRIGSIINPIFELIISNKIESRRLVELRDILLPKLMTGEIDVSEIKI